MSMEATAEALVADEVVQEAPVETPSADENDLSAVFDRMNQGEQDETAEPADEVEATEAVEEPEGEAEAAEVEIPETVPGYLKEKWSSIPEDTRNAILKDRDQLNRRLSDMGRQYQGIAPVRDSLVNAIKEFPALKDMKPEQAAAEIFQLAKVSQDFKSKPVETMMGLIKQHGLEQALSQALSGKEITQDAKSQNTLLQEIAGLKKQLEQVSDPEYFRSQVSRITSETSAMDATQAFASKAEHWAAVEEYLPLYIPAVQAKLGEGAAPGAVLEAAYKRAVEDYVSSEAPPAPVEEAKAAPDPEKTKAAINAKSVNVTGKVSGKTRTMTEAELLSAAYDRAQKRE